MSKLLYGADFSNGESIETDDRYQLKNPPVAYMAIDPFGDVFCMGFAASKENAMNAIKRHIRKVVPGDSPLSSLSTGRPLGNAARHELRQYLSKHGYRSIKEMRSEISKARKAYFNSCTIEMVETYPVDK